MAQPITTYCHLKPQPTHEQRTNAFSPAICGKPDPGTLMYSSFQPGNMDSMVAATGVTTVVPRCPGCYGIMAGLMEDVWPKS